MKHSFEGREFHFALIFGFGRSDSGEMAGTMITEQNFKMGGLGQYRWKKAKDTCSDSLGLSPSTSYKHTW
jgi:hypothetical protein